MTAPASLAAAPPAASGKRRYLAISIFIVAVLIAITLVTLRAVLASSYKVPSGGMLPTIAVGEHVLVNKLDTTPARGKVLVYKSPENPGQEFVKRVVGMPGDTILFQGGTDLIVNGTPVPTCKIGEWSFVEAEGGAKHTGDLVLENLDGIRYLVFHDKDALGGATAGPWKVKDAEVFVVGDNRENSHDSRMYFSGMGGGVPFDLVKGTVRPQGIIGLPLGAEALKPKLTECLGKN
jgi:signal peptidase I